MKKPSKITAALVAAAHLLCLHGFSYGQQVSNREECSDLPVNIYDAKGYWYAGKVRTCGNSLDMMELTRGEHSPAPGERIIISTGRLGTIALNEPNKPPSPLFRGIPNRPYIIPQDDRWGLYAAVHKKDQPLQTSWNTLGRALPFVPSRFYDLGVFPSGDRFIAYGGLQILRSKRADAYPLNEDSILISVDGISFSNENNLLTMLAPEWTLPRDKRLTEVVYIQRNETPYIFRRAFIPMYSRESVSTEWAAAADNPGSKLLASDKPGLRDRTGNYIALAGALLTIGLLMGALSSSSSSGGSRIGGEDGWRARRDNENDLNRGQSNRSQSTPAIHPFYEEPNWGGRTPR